MIKNTNNVIFKYNGKVYKFVAVLQTIGSNNSFTLDNAFIDQCEINNEFNNLVLTGNIIFRDQYGYIDKSINTHYNVLKLLFTQTTRKQDGWFTSNKDSKVDQIDDTFFITHIEILSRESNVITYKMSFVSHHIFNCLSNITYTNYKDEPTSIFNILKTCIKKANLEIDTDSFDNIKTQVTLKYITNGNDNLFTITKYLLNKLYYLSEKDDSIKFLFFNPLHKNFQLFDIKNTVQSSGIYNVTLSFFNTATESMTNIDAIQLATKSSYSTLDSIKNLFPMSTTEYSYDDNTFNNNITLPTTIAKFLNKTYDSDLYANKYALTTRSDWHFLRRNSGWNNDISIYTEAINSLFNCNSLILNVNLDINIKPGTFINLVFDRQVKQMLDTTSRSMKDFKTRYKSLEGAWILHKVKHIINPATCVYKQNVLLMRNYSIKY
jgi:hypothetical protein